MSGNEKYDHQSEEDYEKARKIAENALEKYAEGDQAGGDEMIDVAKNISLLAVQDIYDELEEDAESEHDPDVLNRD